jgi:hypothetical protein
MTSQEKKALKQTMAVEKKLAKRKQYDLEEETTTETTTPTTTSAVVETSAPKIDDKEDSSTSYHQLAVNSAAMEQELAELRGERGGLPPVVLSAPMALQAQGVLPGTEQNNLEQQQRGDDNGIKYMLMYDHALSEQWAKSLKESMLPADLVRQKEDMRPMAYQLTPEPWNRMRPHLNETKYETKIRPSVFESSGPPQRRSIITMTEQSSATTIIPDTCQWAKMPCRPPSSDFDVDISILFEYLYRDTPFHVSCGAKFGSDFLIYDGPREERHAFAGLRVLSSASAKGDTRLPLPTAYSLSGYVRCLNTAGKLALLATVLREPRDDGKTILYRIALVDVALEKILTAPTHHKRARTQVRRDVTQNLAKK